MDNELPVEEDGVKSDKKRLRTAEHSDGRCANSFGGSVGTDRRNEALSLYLLMADLMVWYSSMMYHF